MSGGGQNTVVQNSQPPAAFMDAYQNLLYKANQTAQDNPYRPYQGNIVAGLSPDQQTAIGQIQGTQGIAQPYINNAASYINQSNKPLAPTIAPETNTGLSLLNEAGNWTQAGASPVSAANIAQFENPYTQQVVQATQKEFANQNAQQQQQIQGQAAQQGAFGGDRQAVQAGITAGQQQLAQAPVIAGLESQGFNTALSAAMQQKQLEQQAGQGLTSQAQGVTGIGNLNLGANEANNWLASQAGYGMANLGNEALNTTLSPAQALLGVGGLEQQINQEQLNVPYQNYIGGQAYPFQTTSWLGGLTEGLGGAAGGSSSTNYPGASVGSQITGGALTGLGLYGMANQAGLFGAGAGLGAAGQFGGYASGAGLAAMSGTGAGLGAAGLAGTGALTLDSAGLTGAGAAGGAGLLLFNRGGRVPRRGFGGMVPHSNVIPFHPRLPHPANDAFPHSPIRQAAVGGIGAHFDAGGGVEDDMPLGFGDLVMPRHVDDYGGIAPQARSGIAPDVTVTPQGFSRWQDSVPQAGAGGPGLQSLALADVQPEPSRGIAPPPPPARPSTGGPALLATNAAPTATPEAPTSPPPPQAFTDAATPEASPATTPEHAQRAGSKMPWETLIAMGLGMMGGRSPNAMTNIGEGGLKGLEFGERVRAQDENAKLRELQQQELSAWHQATASNQQQRTQIYGDRSQAYDASQLANAEYRRMRANNPTLSQAQLQQQVISGLMHTTNPDTGQPFTQAEAYDHTKGFQFKQQAQDLALKRAFDTHEYHQAQLTQNANKQQALEKWRSDGMQMNREKLDWLKSKGVTDQDLRTYTSMAQTTGAMPKPEAAHAAAESLRQQNAPAAPAAASPAPQALPMPKSAADAIPGKVYNTQRGPARWDGQQFIPE